MKLLKLEKIRADEIWLPDLHCAQPGMTPVF
jgi:hypothetical protein